jgi:hypothetical protein
MSKQRRRMIPDNVKAKKKDDTRQCQSKDGGGHSTMSKQRWGRIPDNVKVKKEDTQQCQSKDGG